RDATTVAAPERKLEMLNRGESVVAAGGAESAPVPTLSNLDNQSTSQRRVTRGSIGVSFRQDQGTNSITLKSLAAPYGVVIAGVEPGSPAEKAGLKGGDVLTNVNGQPMKSGNGL